MKMKNTLDNASNAYFNIKRKIMKKSILILVYLFLSICSSYGQQSENSQTATPLFNPKTNCQLRYYYYPNLEAYFDTFKKIYYYKLNGEWQTGEEIPEGYRGYSIYNKITAFITDYDDDYPCQFIEKHKKKFPYITRMRGQGTTVNVD